jgi:hypothetical protein
MNSPEATGQRSRRLTGNCTTIRNIDSNATQRNISTAGWNSLPVFGTRVI